MKKCEKCGVEIPQNEDVLIEYGETPEEQTIHHIHVCKRCAELIKNEENNKEVQTD